MRCYRAISVTSCNNVLLNGNSMVTVLMNSKEDGGVVLHHLQVCECDTSCFFLHTMRQSAANPVVIDFKDCYDYDAVCPHDSLHFKSAEEWKSHHLDQHTDTKWKCPLCGVESKSWYNYTYHVQTAKHQSVCSPPWICKLKRHNVFPCGARYGSKYQLIRHICDEHTNYKVCTLYFECAVTRVHI